VSTVIATIIAVAAFIGVVCSAVSAVLGLLTRKKVQSIEVNVDGRLSKLLESQDTLLIRQGQLVDTLNAAGVPVPAKPPPAAPP
jgi:hypothetical protein